MLFLERKSNGKAVLLQAQEEEINAKEEGKNFLG